MMRQTLVTCAVVLTAALSGCKSKEAEPIKPVKFLVSSPLRTDTELTREYVAQIRAIQHIEVRAIEKGYLQDIYVDEGQRVHTGDKLFRIRPAMYDAELQKASASAEVTQIEYDNTKALADRNVVSKKELSMARARANEAKAEVSLASTKKGMTQFDAPFDGLVGKFFVRKGSLLDKGDLMTTLSDNSKLWVYFNMSESEYLGLMQDANRGKDQNVRLMMANGKIYDSPGEIQTVESDFDNATGNIAFRAGFANPNGLLRHGETGKILLTVPLKNALLIPQEATFDVLEKKFVYTVDSNSMLHAQAVTVAAEMPQVFAISHGLKEGDRILIDGLRRVREGLTIEPDFKEPQAVIKSLNVPAE